MLGLGLGEILLIAGLLLVVVGPERLPSVMQWAGRGYGQLRRAADELRRAFVLESERSEAEERYRQLQQRREAAAAEQEAATTAAGEGVVPQPPAHPRPSDGSVPTDEPAAAVEISPSAPEVP